MQFKLSVATLAVALTLASDAYALPSYSRSYLARRDANANKPPQPQPQQQPQTNGTMATNATLTTDSGKPFDPANTKFQSSITVNQFCPVDLQGGNTRTDVTDVEKAWYRALQGYNFVAVWGKHHNRRQAIQMGQPVENPDHQAAIVYTFNDELGDCNGQDSKFIRFTLDPHDHVFKEHAMRLQAANLLCSNGIGRIVRVNCHPHARYVAWKQPEGEKILHIHAFNELMKDRGKCTNDLHNKIRPKIVDYLLDLANRGKQLLDGPNQFNIALKMDLASDNTIKKDSIKVSWRGFDSATLITDKTNKNDYSRDAIVKKVEAGFKDDLCDNVMDASEKKELAGNEDENRGARGSKPMVHPMDDYADLNDDEDVSTGLRNAKSWR